MQAAIRQAYSVHPFQWSQWHLKLPHQNNMDNNFNEIEDLQNERINTDYNCDDHSELNWCMAFENEVILNVNIRSSNANFHKLLVFLISLVIKPYIIVCTNQENVLPAGQGFCSNFRTSFWKGKYEGSHSSRP